MLEITPINQFYNHQRLHSGIGYLPSAVYEEMAAWMNVCPFCRAMINVLVVSIRSSAMNDVYKPPESNLLNDAQPERIVHIIWKIYFWVNVLFSPVLLIILLIVPNLTIFDFIDGSTLIIVVVALWGFIKAKKIGPQVFWRGVTFIYPVWFVFYELIGPIFFGMKQYGEPFSFDAWFVLVLAFGLLTMLALYVYAFKSNDIWSSD